MSHRIYRGAVYHQRLEPRRHAFQYPVFFVSLDTRALDRDATNALFGYNRRRLLSLRDEDYLDGEHRPVDEKIRAVLDDPTITRIQLVTVPRVLGHVFNPVSFYLGYDTGGQPRAAVAEVNNTFGERHLYVLRDLRRDAQGFLRVDAAKDFHVSPFNDREGQYQFRIKEDGERLEIHVDIEREGAIVFRSGLVGSRSSPWSAAQLMKTALTFPFQNLLTLPRIHLHAAHLYFRKKMRYFPKPGPRSAMTIKIAPPTALEKLGMKIFHRLLENLQAGILVLTLPDGDEMRFGPGGDGPSARLHVTDYTFYRRILLDGDIGLGEAYMYGQWTTDDLTGFIQFLIANRDALQNGEIASSRMKWLINRATHVLRSNTKRRSRKNISAHYDLSNDFFTLFLDPTMMYSSAVFARPGDTLEQAQHNKMRRLIELAGLRPDHHVLEIGSGWGGMAIEMARQAGCRVTSITISEQQLKLARERVAAAGLQDRVSIEFRDYRDVQGAFDRVVSIEMLEAVGHEHFDSYFQTIDRVLKPGGRAVIQVITIPHERYDSYRNSVDWIQKHIFPGGHLPSVEALAESMARSTRLRIAGQDDIGPHYAPTLRQWSANLAAARERLSAMGYDDVFYRTWQYYFSYCEAAFATRTLGNHHLTLERA